MDLVQFGLLHWVLSDAVFVLSEEVGFVFVRDCAWI